MSTTGQVQIRVSVSTQLGDLLKSKAQRLGVPLTQLVKHLLITEVKNEEYPTFQMSEKTEKNVEKALEDYKNGKAVKINSISEYFKNL